MGEAGRITNRRRTRPDIRAVRDLAAHALGQDVEVSPVDEGVSTDVYRLTRGREAFYLRVLPEEGASFASEVEVHARLLSSGVRVPEVVYWDDRDRTIGRSVMITREIGGRAIGRDDPGAALPSIARAAGRDLALINQVPVEGFGWIRRDSMGDAGLRAEAANESEFMLADLEACLEVLQGTILERSVICQVRVQVDEQGCTLDAAHASLAHGDFDATHIFAREGRYTGIIDFGEIRGTGPYYDLGHFRFHDGETIPTMLLPSLLEGYGEVVPLPPGADRRIALNSLLIGVGFLARTYDRLPQRNRLHAIAAVERDLEALQTR